MQMLVDRDGTRSGQEQPGLGSRLGAVLRAIDRRYDPDGEVDLAARSGALVAYGLYVGALVAGSKSRRHDPSRYDMRDLLLGGLATHKFARLITKSSVAAPLRAPFTEFEECSGPSEHNERPRHDSHARHAIGELLTCPFCLGVWVGTGYVASLAMAPKAARAWAAVFTVTGIADTMQHVYDSLKDS